MTRPSHSTESLKKILADTYTLYLKTQNYHWNVTGSYFYQLHTLFEEQYKELQTALDELAERIRSLGDRTPGTFKAFLSLTSLKEGKEEKKAFDMVEDLWEDQNKLVKSLHEGIKSAEKTKDFATGDLLIERVQVHEKNAWMLASFLEK